MTAKSTIATIAFLAGLTAYEHGALAAHPRNIDGAAQTPPIAEGAYVAAPLSYTKFCMDYPSECPAAAGPARVHLTKMRRAELDDVNAEVNGSIIPTPDTSAYRFWALNVRRGDCNEFAVQKRHELIERGWSAGALALAVVKTAWGEGHLVLTVRTDAGDFVLDNLRSRIVPWQLAGYRWIMRQSERNPQYWADLNGGRAGSIYALRSQESDGAVAALDAAAPPATSHLEASSPTVSTPDTPATNIHRGGRGAILGFADLDVGIALAANLDFGASFANLDLPPAQIYHFSPVIFTVPLQALEIRGTGFSSSALENEGAEASDNFTEIGLRGSLDS